MKNVKLLAGLLLAFLMISGPSVVSSAVPGDLVVTMDAYHRDFFDEHSTADGLEGNLTDAGSTFNLIGENDTWALPADTDVLLMPATDDEFTAAETTAISDWFTGDGPKLFWAAGDSDFSGFFDVDPLNTLLGELGSDLRLGAESIEDATANDGAPYRVAATQPVTDGGINSVIMEGIEAGLIFHGPAPILAEVDGEAVDVTTLSNAEVLIQTADTAVAIDSDLSETKYDYYTANEIDAPFPMAAIQDLGDGKWVIVSGEAVFTDYKFMYGVVTESGEFNDGVAEGKKFTDNVLSWFSENGADDSIGGGLPISIVPFALAIAVVAVVYRRRK